MAGVLVHCWIDLNIKFTHLGEEMHRLSEMSYPKTYRLINH